jgi:hypothetical protein
MSMAGVAKVPPNAVRMGTREEREWARASGIGARKGALSVR